MAAMQIFIPWSDELAEEYPDLVTRLVPYQPGMHCAHLADIDEAKMPRPENLNQGLNTGPIKTCPARTWPGPADGAGL